MHRNPEVERALQCARYFRDAFGWQPLPSKSRVKGPDLESYADYWDQPLPDSVFATWKARNIQLMTGVRWRLCVVDCDGDEARAAWARMAADHGGLPETWTVATGGGGGGTHTYFATPPWLDACPSRRLWGLWDTYAGPNHRGDWLKHREVRLLADHALVIAPPSTHVATGQPYRWTNGPRQRARPAEAPGWIFRLPAIGVPSATVVAHPLQAAQPQPVSRHHRRPHLRPRGRPGRDRTRQASDRRPLRITTRRPRAERQRLGLLPRLRPRRPRALGLDPPRHRGLSRPARRPPAVLLRPPRHARPRPLPRLAGCGQRPRGRVPQEKKS